MRKKAEASRRGEAAEGREGGGGYRAQPRAGGASPDRDAAGAGESDKLWPPRVVGGGADRVALMGGPGSRGPTWTRADQSWPALSGLGCVDRSGGRLGGCVSMAGRGRLRRSLQLFKTKDA